MLKSTACKKCHCFSKLLSRFKIHFDSEWQMYRWNRTAPDKKYLCRKSELNGHTSCISSNLFMITARTLLVFPILLKTKACPLVWSSDAHMPWEVITNSCHLYLKSWTQNAFLICWTPNLPKSIMPSNCKEIRAALEAHNHINHHTKDE